MTEIPRDSMAMNDEEEAEYDDLDEDQNPDKRTTQHRFDKFVEKPGELSDSEDEEMNEANGVRKQPDTRKRRNRLDYRNLTEWNGESTVTSRAVTPQAGSSGPENEVEDDLNIEEADQLAAEVPRKSVSPTHVVNGDVHPLEESSFKIDGVEADVAMQDVEAEVAAPSIEDTTTVDSVNNENNVSTSGATTATGPMNDMATTVTAIATGQQAVTPPDSPPTVPATVTPKASTDVVPPNSLPLQSSEQPPPAVIAGTAGAVEPPIKNEMTVEDGAMVLEGENLSQNQDSGQTHDNPTEMAERTTTSG